MGTIAKAKNKARAKVKAKMTRAAKKTGKAVKAASAVATAVVVALITGCASSGEQPARSQNQHNEFDNCFFYVTGTSSNNMPANEVFTQTQSNEGSESVSPTSTPTQSTSTDLKAQLPAKRSPGLVAAVINALGFGGKDNADSKCADGSRADGSRCPDGNCSECHE